MQQWLKKPYWLHVCVPLVLLFVIVSILSSATLPTQAADSTPIPLVTLVPPTLLPPAPTPTPIPPITKSALARIKARATGDKTKAILIVGIPYNIERFASINTTGGIDGFEADIARAIADDWGVDLQFKQVTRDDALNLLLSGQIDLLMGQVLLTRDNQSLLDYSDPFFANRQVALTLGDFQGDSKDLNGKTVGVVTGSISEKAFTDWASANGVQATVNHFVMMDDALRALGNKAIAAIIDDRWELDHFVGSGKNNNVRLLATPFRIDPYAIAMPRYDVNLRTLVNRTLQRLADSNRLDPIYNSWFSASDLPASDRLAVHVWDALSSDSRALDTFPNDVVLPAAPVIPRLKSGKTLRVAGLGEPNGPNGSPSVLEGFNQAMITEMARRWGAQVELVPDSYGKGEDLLASGQADLAVGLIPHWGTADRVDFVGIYAQRGYRIMARQESKLTGVDDLYFGKRDIGYYSSDPASFDIIKNLMVSKNILEASINKVPIGSDSDAVDAVFNNNIRIFFGDSFRLTPLAQANAAKVFLTDTIYNPKSISFAVPRNDADFRVLVDVTLQEMAKDGTYQKIWKDKFNQGDPLPMIQWPGTTTLFGIKTTN